MFKIAILGCENSHAHTFLALLKNGRHPDVEVIGIYSDEEQPPKRLQSEFGVPIMKSYDELVGKVDGIMITARHGDNHYKYAKPYLASGIPMFIDKPITCNGAEAVEFMREAKKHGVRLSGGSTCKYSLSVLEIAEQYKNGDFGDLLGAHICAPLELPNIYGGFYFYAQHLVQMVTAIFGNTIESVCADFRDPSASALMRCKDVSVTASYIGNCWNYFVGVYGSKLCRSEQCKASPDSSNMEFDDFYDLLTGKEMKESYDSFIYPVFVLDALVRSNESRQWEPINVIPV
ncbi:MAG: Gfo/Idh/MocA family oxidoreductase [Clostridia bacterium]|nr:Gfo/Idh/MocA family oxidoreductase [Clostridia bacterium]